MILYSQQGLEKLGVTEEQMETKIADEMSLSNEVAANSMINLQFNLVHVAKVCEALFWTLQHAFRVTLTLCHPPGPK